MSAILIWSLDAEKKHPTFRLGTSYGLRFADSNTQREAGLRQFSYGPNFMLNMLLGVLKGVNKFGNLINGFIRGHSLVYLTRKDGTPFWRPRVLVIIAMPLAGG